MIVDPVHERIRLYARQLKLPTFSRYPDILQRARPDARIEELLLELMKAETAQRQENRNRRRLKTAGFPYAKTPEEPDLSRYNGKLSAIFANELAGCRFITEKKSVVMVGNPGRDKTHMAIGLALKACALGMSMLLKNAATLSTELSEAKDNYVLGRLEKRIRQAVQLMLDEMRCVSFDGFQSELLFKVVSNRSERGSVIVTTNLPFSR